MFGVCLKDFIMQPPHGTEVEHINGNTLDCRRQNLRIVPKGTAKPANDESQGEPFTLLKPGDPVPSYAVWFTREQLEDAGVDDEASKCETPSTTTPTRGEPRD
jgi:hypothetical protein